MRVTKKKTRIKKATFLMFMMPRFSCTYLIEAHAAQLVQAGGKQEWLDQGLAAAPIKVQMVMMKMVIVIVETPGFDQSWRITPIICRFKNSTI